MDHYLHPYHPSLTTTHQTENMKNFILLFSFPIPQKPPPLFPPRDEK